jgi:hypothetical protein
VALDVADLLAGGREQVTGGDAEVARGIAAGGVVDLLIARPMHVQSHGLVAGG